MDPISAILTIGGSVLGGLSGNADAKAAREAAKQQNKYIKRQYRFDRKAWRYNRRTIRADYRHAVQQWEMNQRNEETLAAYKDASNLQDWQHQLQIQDYEYRSQMRQYAKSEEVYGQQLTFNAMAAEAAKEAEYRKLQDATNEISFQNQDIVIKAMEAEGAAAVKGQQGRSANKAEQSVFASLGRNQAILAESLLSARADTNAALKKIAADKFGADISAQAARMIEPERLPTAPKPLTTPRAEFLAPRKPKKHDFGPRPIKGAKATMPANNAWIGAAASAVTGIAGLIPRK